MNMLLLSRPCAKSRDAQQSYADQSSGRRLGHSAHVTAGRQVGKQQLTREGDRAVVVGTRQNKIHDDLHCERTQKVLNRDERPTIRWPYSR